MKKKKHRVQTNQYYLVYSRQQIYLYLVINQMYQEQCDSLNIGMLKQYLIPYSDSFINRSVCHLNIL